jgi:serine/threonine protein kinase
MPRTTAISGIDLSNEDSLKELAIILLCGCLFALKKFLYHRSEPGSTVFDFAEEVRRVPGMLFHTASPSFIAVECDHVWWRDGRLFVDLCALCKAKAFRAAVYLKKRITWIPMLERTGNVVSYDNRNIPFIREVPALRQRIRPNPQFFTVSIEPTRFNNELAVCIPFLLWSAFGVLLICWQTSTLFCKRYRYQAIEDETELRHFEIAKREAEIAVWLSQLPRRSIVDVIFAFTAEDRDFRVVNMVFPLYHDTLENYMLRDLNTIPQSSLFNHPLWSAMFDILDAIAAIHDETDGLGQVPEQRNRPHFAGHFDIKPANILVEHEPTNLKLVLTDFGQAAANRHGDSNFAPPEIFCPRTMPAEYLKPAYDVWSLACVLLRCIIFMEGGVAGITAFVDRLLDSSNRSRFWEGPTPMDARLATVVRNNLDRLQNHRDFNIRTIGLQLQNMLDTMPGNRPTARACLMVLARADNRRGILEGRDHMNCGSEVWHTTSTTPGQSRVPVPLRLSLYRDSYQLKERGRGEEIFVDIAGDDGEKLACSSVHFQPLACYDMLKDEPPAGYTFRCRFDTALQPRTFHFKRLDEFLKFMALVTRQEILPLNDRKDGLRIAFGSAVLKRYGRFFGSHENFGMGYLQVWRQLGKLEYDVSHVLHLRAYQNLTRSIRDDLTEPNRSRVYSYHTTVYRGICSRWYGKTSGRWYCGRIETDVKTIVFALS